MDLFHEPKPVFTHHIVERRLLGEPFVLLDIGVQGGIQPHWRALDRCLEVHGFDALEEEIDVLRAAGEPGHRYHALALGDADGERDLFVQKVRCSTSLYRQSASAFAVDAGVVESEAVRRVKTRRLDTLREDGVIARIDFIKVDCEGAEPEILRGGEGLLAEGDILGAEIETAFNASAVLPETHFAAVQAPLLRAGLVLQDLAFNRIPYASFARRAAERGLSAERLRTRARPATFNVLFTRDPAAWSPRSADAVLKLAIIFELYGLNDSAYEVLTRFAPLLAPALGGVGALADRLLRPPPPRRANSFLKFYLAAARRALKS